MSLDNFSESFTFSYSNTDGLYASVSLNKGDLTTLPDVVNAFNTFLQAAGYTYVEGVTAYSATRDFNSH